MPNKKKNIILSIIGITLILIMLLGATYAYFQAQIKDGDSSEVAIDTDTVDILTFNATDDIKLEATQETFSREKGNISGSTTLNAHLIANSTTQSATYKYNVYLDITKNNFVYSTSNSTPEIVLVIKNPKGQYVTTRNDKIGKTTNVELNDEQVTGYDITTKIGLIEISLDYLIDASPSTKGEADQNWEISVVFVNLDSNQVANAGKSFKAKAKVQSEKINVLDLGRSYAYYRGTGISSSSSGYRNQIKNVYFVNYIASEEELNSVSTNANWDLSSVKDRSIMGWLKANNEDEAVPYDLYIGSNLQEGEKIVVRSFAYAFYNMTKLETVDLNLDILDTSNLNDISYMFESTSKLNTITGIEDLGVSNVMDMSRMFSSASNLTELDLSNWNTHNVTDMSGMFGSASNLTELDLSSWDTHNVTDMSGMFERTSSLKKININGWDTHNVTDMSDMFYLASSLTLIVGIENLDVSNVTNMSNMFASLRSLEELDLSNWNVSNVINMSSMFEENSGKLRKVNVKNWNTQNVTDMSSMFGMSTLGVYSTYIIIEGVENFDVSNVTNMRSMFNGLGGLTKLDLSSWDTHSVTDMTSMFNYARSLTNIDMRRATFSQVTSYNNMFYSTNSALKVTITGDANKQWFLDSMSNDTSYGGFGLQESQLDVLPE